jgi:hypothetical protein
MPGAGVGAEAAELTPPEAPTARCRERAGRAGTPAWRRRGAEAEPRIPDPGVILRWRRRSRPRPPARWPRPDPVRGAARPWAGVRLALARDQPLAGPATTSDTPLPEWVPRSSRSRHPLPGVPGPADREGPNPRRRGHAARELAGAACRRRARAGDGRGRDCDSRSRAQPTCSRSMRGELRCWECQQSGGLLALCHRPRAPSRLALDARRAARSGAGPFLARGVGVEANPRAGGEALAGRPGRMVGWARSLCPAARRFTRINALQRLSPRRPRMRRSKGWCGGIRRHGEAAPTRLRKLRRPGDPGWFPGSCAGAKDPGGADSPIALRRLGGDPGRVGLPDRGGCRHRARWGAGIGARGCERTLTEELMPSRSRARGVRRWFRDRGRSDADPPPALTAQHDSRGTGARGGAGVRGAPALSLPGCCRRWVFAIAAALPAPAAFRLASPGA